MNSTLIHNVSNQLVAISKIDGICKEINNCLSIAYANSLHIKEAKLRLYDFEPQTKNAPDYHMQKLIGTATFFLPPTRDCISKVNEKLNELKNYTEANNLGIPEHYKNCFMDTLGYIQSIIFIKHTGNGKEIYAQLNYACKECMVLVTEIKVLD